MRPNPMVAALPKCSHWANQRNGQSAGGRREIQPRLADHAAKAHQRSLAPAPSGGFAPMELRLFPTQILHRLLEGAKIRLRLHARMVRARQ